MLLLDGGAHSLAHAHAVVAVALHNHMRCGRHVRMQHVLGVHRRHVLLVVEEQRVVGRRPVVVVNVNDEV